jgi:hypothetical protein
MLPWLIILVYISWLAFGTIFRITGGYRKAGIIFLRRVTGRNFKIS